MNQSKNLSKIKKISVVAMFCALAYVCTVFIKIPGISGFLTLDIKDSIIVLCTLIFGPSAGLIIAVVVPLLEMVTVSSTGLYGFLMNVLSSVTFAMVSGCVYRLKKSFFGAVLSLTSGVFAVTAVMMVANLLITPFYMGVSVQTVASLIPRVLLPFNFLKAILNAAIVLLFYKPLSGVLKKAGLAESKGAPVSEKTANAQKGRSLAVTVTALVLIALSLAVILLVLK